MVYYVGIIYICIFLLLYWHHHSDESANILKQEKSASFVLKTNIFFRYLLLNFFWPRPIFDNLTHATMLPFEIIYGRLFFLFNVFSLSVFFPFDVISSRCLFLFDVWTPSTFFSLWPFALVGGFFSRPYICPIWLFSFRDVLSADIFYRRHFFLEAYCLCSMIVVL